MRLEAFWINCGSDTLPTELECSSCNRTVGEIAGGATLAVVLEMAERHKCATVIDGETAPRAIAA